jgi:GTP 3',8-cyclase
LDKKLIDRWGRTINYLRMSVTGRCNYRCAYCMPEDNPGNLARRDWLTLEELARIGRVFALEGIQKIRLTGGEPLLRNGLHILVRKLHRLEGLRDLGLTTNGHLLLDFADILAGAGLRRVNVSLDSLNAGKFNAVTQGGDLSKVLNGLDYAKRIFAGPVKINVVVWKGFNEDETLDFARLTLDPGYHVRFIELMPMRARPSWNRGQVVPAAVLRAQISGAFGLAPVAADGAADGPASRYRIPGAEGELGFIGATTEGFCANCNRIRLTPDGKLRGCLLNDGEIDLRAVIRNGASDEILRERLAQLLLAKPERHSIGDPRFMRPQRTMSQIGG